MNKYEFTEGIMASDLSNAVKVFAYGIAKHMFGEKTESCPGEDALMKATNLSRGHFSKYRRTLVESGWLIMEVRKTKNGNSYTYRLPETAPVGGALDEQTAPSGAQSAPSGAQTAPSGCVNTVLNTIKKTVQEKKTGETTPGADAPVVPSSSNSSLKDDSKDDDSLLTANTSAAGTADTYKVAWLRLKDDEKRFFERANGTDLQKRQAVSNYCNLNLRVSHWMEKAERALELAGIESEEW